MKQEILSFKEREKHPPLIGYLPALYPDTAGYREMLGLCSRLGLRFIEVGIPCENPYLDGPVIQQALTAVLKSVPDPLRTMEASGRIVRSSGLRGVAMMYDETLETLGVDSMIDHRGATAFEAVLVPNVKEKNRRRLYDASLRTGMEIANFIGFHQGEEEVREIAAETTGFLYLQSAEGSTGGQFVGDSEMAERVRMVKEIAEPLGLPVALGFGINSPCDAEQAAAIGADAVIVGTAFLRVAQRGTDSLSVYLKNFSLHMEDVRCPG